MIGARALRQPCITILLALLAAGCGGGRGAAAVTDQAPNILWLVAEDMSPALGSYGDSFARTPHLDALARAGVRYTHAFATAPACSPARSTLITGVYATSTGTAGLRSSFSIPGAFRGFPAFLREAGYYTTNNVKTDYNTRDEPRLVAESWNESSNTAHWRGNASGQPFFAVFNFMHTHQSRTSFLDEDWPEIGEGVGVHDPADVSVPPFYPDDPDVRRTLAQYYDAVHAMDAEAGRILEQLEEDGLAGDTIVFFYTDHGMGLPRGKRTLYDTGLQVPLIARFPDKYRHLAPAAPGGTVDRLVSFVDFPPTILSLARVPIPGHMPGHAFLGAAAHPEARRYVHGARDRVDEAFDLSRSIRDERYLYTRNYAPHLSWNAPEGYSDLAPIRRTITRLAQHGRLDRAQMTYAGATKPVEELFDTLNDRHQIHNLAASPAHADVLERMRAGLRAWVLETRDLGFMPEGELARRTTGDITPWEIGRDESAYRLSRVLDAADLVGRSGVVDRQRELLGDDDPVVRYWAAVGLRAAGDAAASAAPALRRSLRDPIPEVRIQVADTLARLDAAPHAMETLTEALSSDEPYVVLFAARTLQLLGPNARPARRAMERVLAAAHDDDSYGGLGMYVRFALQPALATLSGPAEHMPFQPHRGAR